MFRGVCDSLTALTFTPRLSRLATETPHAGNSFIEELFRKIPKSPASVGPEITGPPLRKLSTRQNFVTGATLSPAPVSFSANGRAGLKPNYLSEEEASTAGVALDPVSGDTRTFSVNRYAFVDRATADRLAEMLGGTVETRQVGENGGPFRGPVQYVIRIGEYAGDAALIARRYETLPQWIAELSTRMEIASENGETPPSWNDALAQLNSGQEVLGVRLA